MLFGGGFVLFMFLVMALSIVPLIFWIFSLVEVGRAPAQAFGPPWDNTRNAWLLGLAVSAVIPIGILVSTILWWTQGHAALRAGAPVPRPFWAPRPAYPYPPQQPPQPPLPPQG